MRFAVSVACAGCVLALALAFSGCRSVKPTPAIQAAQYEPPGRATPLPKAESAAATMAALPAVKPTHSNTPVNADPPTPGRAVAYEAPLPESLPPPKLPVVQEQPNQLDVDWLVYEVLARNPDIQSAVAAWQAAAQRYPQEFSLEDPMFAYMLGPGTWGNDSGIDSAYLVQGSQKVPWPGKRQLRGSIAQAQANAAYYETGEARLRIAEVTRLAFYRYFLAHRQLEVLSQSTDLLRSFREIAQARYESGEVEQQDVLLADVELADLERRRLELLRNEQVSRARLNTLLLVTPDAQLPPPPTALNDELQLPPSDALRQQALGTRPELAAQQARIRAERYSIQLAHKEFFPDMEFVGRYDAFWQEDALRPMVGMNLNVPVYKQKRYAAVREASARLSQQQATLDSQINEIMFEVEQAYRRVEESRQAVQVFEDHILPAAEQSVGSAKLSYTAGRLDFLRLIESQRQLLAIQDRYYEAVANYHQRLAELDRAIGSTSSGFSAR